VSWFSLDKVDLFFCWSQTELPGNAESVIDHGVVIVKKGFTANACESQDSDTLVPSMQILEVIDTIHSGFLQGSTQLIS